MKPLKALYAVASPAGARTWGDWWRGLGEAVVHSAAFWSLLELVGQYTAQMPAANAAAIAGIVAFALAMLRRTVLGEQVTAS